MTVIIERVDAKTDQMSKVGKVNTLCLHYKLYFHLVDPIIVVKSALHGRYTAFVKPLECC